MDLAPHILEYCASGFTPATIATYSGELGRLDQYLSGREPTEPLLAFFCRQPPAPGTQTKRRHIIQSFFLWLLLNEKIDSNPAQRLQQFVKPGSQGVKQHNWLTKAQVDDLLAVSEPSPRNHLLLLLPLSTGLRRAELAALRWDQIHLPSGYITLTGKGNKPARLGIPKRLERALSKADREQGPLNDIGVTRITQIVKRYGAKIDVPTLAPHDLRRTFASLLLEQTGDIYAVSRALRHSSVATTMVYMERSPAKTIQIGRDFDI